MITKLMRNKRLTIILTMALGIVAGLTLVLAQDPPAKSKEPVATPPAIPRMTIEVTGGDSNKPVENASVYVKTIEEHSVLKDKKTELNVKTNQNGVAHIPDAPTGRVLIQIVAEGWKSYGHWYDVADPRQVIKIHLDRPPKWY
jgi:hypothetical protein